MRACVGVSVHGVVVVMVCGRVLIILTRSQSAIDLICSRDASFSQSSSARTRPPPIHTHTLLNPPTHTLRIITS